MLKVKDITKIFSTEEVQTLALDGVSFEIKDGEFVAIMGPSGCGKSTLMNILGLLDNPTSGSYELIGQEVGHLKEKDRTQFRKGNIGFIFQQYYLLPNMTVEKNVRMGADLSGNANDKEMIEAVGLGDKLTSYPSELSGGEQQRVSVARALAKKPKILFLDEPTGALDSATGRQVLDYIGKLHKQYGFTVIMITHNQNIAEMAKTVIRINSGRITEVYENAQQKTAYEIGW